mmetsp:Transcript_37256/g.73827  ORF Transcript_37256/g.73827 Transcript_37256/m.73827 type:complete len:281 (-) Transcript_37256:25-867(-)
MVPQLFHNLETPEQRSDHRCSAAVDIDSVDTTPEWSVPVPPVERRALRHSADAIVVHEDAPVPGAIPSAVRRQCFEDCSPRVDEAVSLGHDRLASGRPNCVKLCHQVLVSSHSFCMTVLHRHRLDHTDQPIAHEVAIIGFLVLEGVVTCLQACLLDQASRPLAKHVLTSFDGCVSHSRKRRHTLHLGAFIQELALRLCEVHHDESEAKTITTETLACHEDVPEQHPEITPHMERQFQEEDQKGSLVKLGNAFRFQIWLLKHLVGRIAHIPVHHLLGEIEV